MRPAFGVEVVSDRPLLLASVVTGIQTKIRMESAAFRLRKPVVVLPVDAFDISSRACPLRIQVRTICIGCRLDTEAP